jgi:transposase
MNVRPLELKRQIVDAYLKKEGTQLQLAKRYNVSVTSVNHWIRIFREKGSLEVSPWKKGPAPRVAGEHVTVLRHIVQANPLATLADLCRLFLTETGIKVSISSMDRYLRGHGIERKKRLINQSSTSNQSAVISSQRADIEAVLASSDIAVCPLQN